MSVARGGRRLMRARLNLDEAGLTEEQWRQRWEAARLFLTADGETDKAWGNETIRLNHDEGWLEVKLPAPLAHLANRPLGRYRLSCQARFDHRGEEVAAQAATGAVRYDITFDPVRGRWYLDASWQAPAGPVPSLDELRACPVVAVDVNAGHLAVAVVAPDGNVPGRRSPSRSSWPGCPPPPATATSAPPSPAHRHREGRRGPRGRNREPGLRRGPRRGPRAHREPALARQARARLPAAARGHPHRPVPGPPGADDRQRRPLGRGRRPGVLITLGGGALAAPLREHHPELSGHHAAALVLGRRGLGHRARRRATGNRTAPADAARPAQARTRKPPAAKTAKRKPDLPRDTRPPPGGKTGRPHRTTAGNQVPEDRSRAPTTQYPLLRSD